VIDYFLSKLGITPILVAGVSLWSLAVYLSLWQWNDRLVDLLGGWLNDTDRKLYSPEVLARRPPGWEERNQLFASVLSLFPAILVACGLYALLNSTLGGSWAIALGLMVSIGAGVYQLGRQDASDSGTDR
jgi:hypothetical protein